jgi:hypothetical protein
MFLTLRPRLRPEPAGETRRGQGLLPGLRVQVEHSALRSRGSACLAFVHHRVDAVPVQDSCQGQSAEAATGDRDSHLHLRYRALYLVDTPHGSEVLPVWERPEPAPRAAPVPLSRAKIAATRSGLCPAPLCSTTQTGGPTRILRWIVRPRPLLISYAAALVLAAVGRGYRGRIDQGAEYRAIAALLCPLICFRAPTSGAQPAPFGDDRIAADLDV